MRCRHCEIREGYTDAGAFSRRALEAGAEPPVRPVVCSACGRVLEAADLHIHDKLRQLACFGFGPAERPLLAERTLEAQRQLVPHGG